LTGVESIACRLYRELEQSAIAYEFRPGERINENALAKRFGVSRTPLREALNRLCSEGFLTFSAKQGFSRKRLEVREIFNLYEFRRILEAGAMKLIVERAAPDQLENMDQCLDQSSDGFPVRSAIETVELDEFWHEQLIALADNGEMLRSLRNIHRRIRYVRCVEMDIHPSRSPRQHKAILAKLIERNGPGSARLMSEHIAQSPGSIVENVERCYGTIYFNGSKQKLMADAG
jgi:DNA-binding GntR family transcriptional regulator